jgi:MaoC like domain
VVVGLFVVLQTVNLVENHFLTEGLVEGAVVVVGVDLQPEDCRLLVLLEALARVEQRRVREQQQQLYTKNHQSWHQSPSKGWYLRREPTQVLVKVGSVDFQQDFTRQPCLGLSATPRKASGFDHSYRQQSYSLNTPYVSTFNAPLTNEPYSKILGDFNLIHVNPYFSDSASLPATITHGLWLSLAATRCYVEMLKIL